MILFLSFAIAIKTYIEDWTMLAFSSSCKEMGSGWLFLRGYSIFVETLKNYDHWKILYSKGKSPLSQEQINFLNTEIFRKLADGVSHNLDLIAEKADNQSIEFHRHKTKLPVNPLDFCSRELKEIKEILKNDGFRKILEALSDGFVNIKASFLDIDNQAEKVISFFDSYELQCISKVKIFCVSINDEFEEEDISLSDDD